ncbi:MAG: hypothetical protein AB8I08_01155 [Sandaracinaceae bacterium]
MAALTPLASDPADVRSTERTRRRLTRALPALAAILAFLPNVDDYFVSDDFDHPFLTGYSWSRFWAHLVEPSTAGEFFRPVGQLSMALDHLLFGQQPEPAHVVSILLHAGCALWVAHLGERLAAHDGSVGTLSPRWVGTLAGVLFAVHPIHPEAVSFLGSRFDLTAAFFGLAGLSAHVRAASCEGRASWNWLAASALLILLAMGSKESALLLPLAVLAYEGWLAPQRRWRRALPAFVVLAAVVLWRLFVVGDLGGYVAAGETRHLPSLDAEFAKELLSFPVYGLLTPVSHAAVGAAAVPAVLLLGGLSLFPVPFVLRRRAHLGAIGWAVLLSVVCALPPSSLFSTSGLLRGLEGARFLYFASAGISLAMAFGLAQVTPRSLRALLVGAHVTLFAVLVVAHAMIWSDSSELARGTVETVLTRCAHPEGPTPTVLVAGPPDNHRGAFLWRNGLGSAIRQLHPASPDARFTRADLEPDFFEPEGFDVRAFVGRRDTCLFRWDDLQGRLEDRTPLLRAATAPLRPDAIDGWSGWTAYNAHEVAREPRWVLRADGEDPHVVSPPLPIGAREVVFTMQVTAPDAPSDAYGEIFWAAGTDAFDVALHHRLIVIEPDGGPHTYRFLLPLSDPAEMHADALYVRIDPTLFPADIILFALTVE